MDKTINSPIPNHTLCLVTDTKPKKEVEPDKLDTIGVAWTFDKEDEELVGAAGADQGELAASKNQEVAFANYVQRTRGWAVLDSGASQGCVSLNALEQMQTDKQEMNEKICSKSGNSKYTLNAEEELQARASSKWMSRLMKAQLLEEMWISISLIKAQTIIHQRWRASHGFKPI